MRLAPTEKEVREQAQDQTPYRLDELIDPSDLGDYDTWEEVPEYVILQELYESASIAFDESYNRHYHHIAYDYAIRMYADDLPRVPHEDLIYDDWKEAIKNGYWPNGTNKWQMLDVLEAQFSDIHELPYEYVEEAIMVVESGIVKGLVPESRKDILNY